MIEREESFLKCTSDLVIAIAFEGPSNTGLAPELKGRRAGICLSLSVLSIALCNTFLQIKTLWSSYEGTPITRPLSSNPLGLTKT